MNWNFVKWQFWKLKCVSLGLFIYNFPEHVRFQNYHTKHASNSSSNNNNDNSSSLGHAKAMNISILIVSSIQKRVNSYLVKVAKWRDHIKYIIIIVIAEQVVPLEMAYENLSLRIDYVDVCAGTSFLCWKYLRINLAIIRTTCKPVGFHANWLCFMEIAILAKIE